MIFQLHVKALRSEPILEGMTAASSVEVVSKVLSQNSSHHFLKSVGITNQYPPSHLHQTKARFGNNSQLKRRLLFKVNWTSSRRKVKKVRNCCRGHGTSWRSTRSK
jgi:hypothetical protein